MEQPKRERKAQRSGGRGTPKGQPPRQRVRIFLEGRYRKFVRDLPQTIFYCPKCKGRRGGCEFCDGYGKLTKDSIQELVARKALRAFRSRKGKFHGAGREDVDVRMLGGGRPFIFEVIDPKNPEVDLAALEKEINEYAAGRIEIFGLHRVERKRVAQIKETPTDKIYRALVELEGEVPREKLEDLPGTRLKIVQRTPTRVAHRRADKERIRQVTIRSAEPAGERLLEIEVRAEHGTYIKEWISGDEGRTRPSLGDLLGVRGVCKELDVLEILPLT